MFAPEYKLFNEQFLQLWFEEHMEHCLSSWKFICKNPNAIPILEKNLDQVEWSYLCSNPSAIHLLEKNLNNNFLKKGRLHN